MVVELSGTIELTQFLLLGDFLMALLKLPAAKVQQGDLTLFSTAIKVKVLIQVETASHVSDSGFNGS